MNNTNLNIEKNPDLVLDEALGQDLVNKEFIIDQSYNFDSMFGSINESLNVNRVLKIKEYALRMPLDEVINFIDRRFKVCFLQNQNRINKMFILLNQIVTLRNDILLDDFAIFFKEILSLEKRMHGDTKLIALIREKVMEDIIIPYCIKGRVDLTSQYSHFALSIGAIEKFLPYSKYESLIDVYLKVENTLPKPITPLIAERLTLEEKDAEDEKDLDDVVFTQDLLKNQEAA